MPIAEDRTIIFTIGFPTSGMSEQIKKVKTIIPAIFNVINVKGCILKYFQMSRYFEILNSKAENAVAMAAPVIPKSGIKMR